MGGGAWPFLVRGVICLVNSDNERDSNFLNRCRQGYDVESCTHCALYSAINLFGVFNRTSCSFDSCLWCCCATTGVIPGGLSEQDTCFLNGQIASSNNEIEQ
jgi:hypothetical protein